MTPPPGKDAVRPPRGDDATEERRALLACDWLVRVYSPAWLDLLPSLTPHAAALRELPEVVGLPDAAGAAAGYAARAAAEDAAEGAAEGAAWNAAWNAARTALRPTMETLQQSALDLLNRMLTCGEDRT